MKFARANRIASLEFDSATEFQEWVMARCQRASERFPGEVVAVADIGPLSVSRMLLDDDAQIAAALERLKAAVGPDVVGVRIPLGEGFSIVELEGFDSASGTIHLWNIGRESEFDEIDERSIPFERSLRDLGEPDEAEALVLFGLAYRELGRSGRFTITAVPRAELKSARRLFAGFCCRCDGLLERTGLRVEEHEHETVLWEGRCLDCDVRRLGWKTGDGRAPVGWKRMSSH